MSGRCPSVAWKDCAPQFFWSFAYMLYPGSPAHSAGCVPTYSGQAKRTGCPFVPAIRPRARTMPSSSSLLVLLIRRTPGRTPGGSSQQSEAMGFPARFLILTAKIHKPISQAGADRCRPLPIPNSNVRSTWRIL
ncbi:hypothetical protein MPLB_2040022 [Mesorhizobium sp. ORS 3324]|nr:hypothetical protein MPLB_2040022 [Mesorhizobium sp. ORS 3324]